MPNNPLCPHCGAPYAVPPATAGKKLLCRYCKGRIEVPAEPAPEEPPEENFDIVEEASVPEIDRRDKTRRDSLRPDLPRKKKKKKPARSETIVDPGLLKIGGGVLAAALGLGGLIWLLSGIFSNAPDAIPDEKWKEVRVENRFKAMLPGPAVQQNQPLAMGMSMRMFSYQPDKDSVYSVGCMEGKLPPERAALPAETLLDDSCNGSLMMLRRLDPDCKELSRTDIKVGDFPGKELVIYIPKGKGRSITRAYLVHGRLIMVLAMGKGLRESNPNVQKLFASFEPLEVPEPEVKKFTVPPESWQPYVAEDLFRVLMPGRPVTRQSQTISGIVLREHQVTLDAETSFRVAHSEHRSALTGQAARSEENGNAAWEDTLVTLRQADPDVTEVRRTEARFGGLIGRQVAVQNGAKTNQSVYRSFWVRGRRYILSVTAPKVSEKDEVALKFFESFAVLDNDEAEPSKLEPTPAPSPAITRPAPGSGLKQPPPPLPGREGPKVAFAIELPKSANENQAATAMGFSRDGKTLAIATGSERVHWFDVDAKKQTETHRIAAPQGCDGTVVSWDADRIAFHKHGGLLYYWEKGEKSETVLSPGEGGMITQYQATFSPDGATVAVTNGFAFVRLWDVKTGKKVTELKPFGGQTAAVAFSPDGKFLACADVESSIWNPKTGKRLVTLEPKAQIYTGQLEFAPDGKSLIAVCDRTLYRWELDIDPSGEKITAQSGSTLNVERIGKVRHSPDGKLLAGITDAGRVRIWDARTLKRQGDLNFSKLGQPGTLAFRPTDGKLAVACGGQILFLNLAQQKWD